MSEVTKIQCRGLRKGIPTKDWFATRIAIQFGTELHDAIQQRANARRTSFAKQVRLLCEKGLAVVGAA